MARYMIVAHQTAASPELMERLRDIAARDDAARFTLVVPETPVAHLLLEDVQESQAAARAAADQAERVMREARLPLDRVTIGAASPIAAIEDELRTDDDYDAVVISTLRPGASRWLDLDVHHRIEHRLALPIIHVCEGGDAAWAGRTDVTEVPIPPPRRLVPPPLDPDDMPPARASRWPIVVALMFAYLLITGGLALGVSRTFFMVDAIAIVVFAIVIAGVRVMERRQVTS